METGKPAIQTCHGGRVDFAEPLIVDGRFTSSVMDGQVPGRSVTCEGQTESEYLYFNRYSDDP